MIGGFEACQLPDFSTQSISGYILYDSTVAGIDNATQFIFSSQDGEFDALNNWTNLLQSIATLEAS